MKMIWIMINLWAVKKIKMRMHFLQLVLMKTLTLLIQRKKKETMNLIFKNIMYGKLKDQTCKQVHREAKI